MNRPEENSKARGYYMPDMPDMAELIEVVQQYARLPRERKLVELGRLQAFNEIAAMYRITPPPESSQSVPARQYANTR